MTDFSTPDKSNVVGLRGAPVITPERKPDPNVVSHVKRLLEQAESGEITGISYVMHHHDTATSRGMAGLQSYSMAGRCHQLIHEIVEALDKA